MIINDFNLLLLTLYYLYRSEIDIINENFIWWNFGNLFFLIKFYFLIFFFLIFSHFVDKKLYLYYK